MLHALKNILLVFLLLSLNMFGLSAQAADNPVEVGEVKWQRDLNAAMRKSRDSGKPIFLLFQEVPGCNGCKQFGQEVLSSPLLVMAIENEFIPVLVFNNRKSDDIVLKRFSEPSWNFPVVRFIDADGKDIIARKERVYDIDDMATRMVEALSASGQTVPKYLNAIATQYR